MGFTRGGGGTGKFPDMAMEITNIGIEYREYDNGAQHKFVIVYEPLREDSKLGVQTDMLNTSNVLKVEGKKQTVTVGGTSENAFDLDVIGDVITGGEVRGKAKVWLDKLEELKVPIAELENTGDISTLIGLQMNGRQMTYSEAIKRKGESKYEEKPFWMPMKILRMPTKKKSLKQEVLEFIGSDKTEDEVIDWCKANKKGMKAVFDTIAEAKEIEESITGAEKTTTFHVKDTKQKTEDKQLEKEVEEEFGEDMEGIE